MCINFFLSLHYNKDLNSALEAHEEQSKNFQVSEICPAYYMAREIYKGKQSRKDHPVQAGPTNSSLAL